LSEVSLTRQDVPQECREYWREAYPAVRTVEANLEAARKAGFDVLGDFTLPGRCWLEEYYAPLRGRMEAMGRKYADNEEIQGMLEMTRTEIRMYEEYSDYYGNQFYVLRRSD
jgi:hypothetical protein